MENEDPNVQLARAYGLVLEGQKTGSEIDDPLYNHLIEYRTFKKSLLEKKVNRQDTLWASLKQKIAATDLNNSAKVISFSSAQKKFISIAATLLIVCFSGLFYYMSTPSVVGQSGSEITTITLNDGSQIDLRPHSILLKEKAFWDQNVTYELQGEGYFDIAPRQSVTFTVRGGPGEVQVLGTKFILSYWGNKTRVYLEEGRIAFSHRETKKSTTLKPGQSAQIKGSELEKKVAEDGSEFMDWINNQLVFSNRSARYIFNELEQHYNIQIQAPQSALELRVTGVLNLKQLQETLLDLELVLEGKFSKLDEHTFKFEPR